MVLSPLAAGALLALQLGDGAGAGHLLLLVVFLAWAVSAPFIQRWALQGTTYAAIAALAVQLVFLAGAALVLARRHFSREGLPRPEDPFDGLPS